MQISLSEIQNDNEDYKYIYIGGVLIYILNDDRISCRLQIEVFVNYTNDELSDTKGIFTAFNEPGWLFISPKVGKYPTFAARLIEAQKGEPGEYFFNFIIYLLLPLKNCSLLLNKILKVVKLP